MFRNIVQKMIQYFTQPTLSLIGVVLAHIGLGIIATWGTNNLYIFSYFHHLGYPITTSTNSKILIFTVIPMTIAMLLTAKLTKKYGVENVMKVGSIIFTISPIIAFKIQNFYIYMIFMLVVPACMFSIVTIPALSCIWSQFPTAKSRVTSIQAIALGVGTMIWNPIIAHSINPNNQGVTQTHQEIQFFSEQVSESVLIVSAISFTCAGILAIIGTLLMKENHSIYKEQQQMNQNKESGQYKEYKNEGQNQLKSQAHKVDKQQIVSQNTPDDFKSEQIITPQQTFLKLSDIFKDINFILLIAFILISTLFEVQLVLNLKIVYMPIIKDDHFLTYCMMILAAVSITTAYLWGYICDKKGIAFCMFLLAILDTALKIFSFFVDSKIMLVLLIILVGIQSKALGSFVAPGFVQMYGIKMGTQLIPYKGIAFLAGFILAPVIQMMTSSFLRPEQYIKVLALSCLISTPLAFIFSYRVRRPISSTDSLSKANKQTNQQL